MFRYYQQILKEEKQALNEKFNGVYYFKNDKSYIELFGDERDMINTSKRYAGILMDSYKKLEEYAEELGFTDQTDAFETDERISSWVKDGWAIFMPYYPKKLRNVKIEKYEKILK